MLFQLILIMNPRALTICILALLFVGCSTISDNATTKTPAANTAPSPTAASTAKRVTNGDYPGKGQVTKINSDLGSFEMDHEEIVGVMPPMRMEFYVSDKKLLNGLAVGDQIDFTLRYKDGTEVVTAISKSK